MGNHSCTLRAKPWDSDFFGRPVFALDVDVTATRGDVLGALATLPDEAWAVEVVLPTTSLAVAPALESAGFRLVDSRATLAGVLRPEDIAPAIPPLGHFRPGTPEDLEAISRLTARELVDNPAVRTRYSDRRLFHRDESIRYYEAWNERSLSEDPSLLVVWEHDTEVIGYYSHLAHGPDPDGLPRVQGGIVAVDHRHRGRRGQVLMHQWVLGRRPEAELRVESSTQLSNLAVIRNHLRTGKAIQQLALTFYWTSDGALGE